MLVYNNKFETKMFTWALLISNTSLVATLFGYTLGKLSPSEALRMVPFFVSLSALSYILRRTITQEMRVLESGIEFTFLLSGKSKFVSFEDIVDATYSELTFKVTLKRKSGKKVVIRSGMVRSTGDFTCRPLTPAEPEGPPGERYRLAIEINDRIAKVRESV